jgi:REP element-mobilizing transposase RayT
VDFPLAYLITFRCYGTWLHGDARSSVDRRGHNVYGTPRIAPDIGLEKADRARLKHPAVTLDAAQRAAVEEAVREVCIYRGFDLQAVNVRTNHVHVVVAAGVRPEVVLNALKSYATRRLRELRLLSAMLKPWARHGSTRYLWRSRHVERAIDYVLNGQGEELPDFND